MKSKKVLLLSVAAALAVGYVWYKSQHKDQPTIINNIENNETVIVVEPSESKEKEDLDLIAEEEILPEEVVEISESDALAMLEFIGASEFAVFAKNQWSPDEIKTLTTSMALYLSEPILKANPFELIMSKQAGFQEMEDGFKAREESIGRGEAPTPLSEAALDALSLALAMNSPITGWESSVEEKEAFLHGVSLGLAGKEAAQSFDDATLEAFYKNQKNKMQERMKADAEARKAKNTAYLSSLKDVEKDPSGFYYKIEAAGSATHPGPSDKVTVHYHGTLTDGTVFDSSKERGQPATFPMNGVISAFSGGLSKIGVNGKIRIYAPPELAYGEQAVGRIPSNSILIFDCELLDIKP